MLFRAFPPQKCEHRVWKVQQSPPYIVGGRIYLFNFYGGQLGTLTKII